MAPPTLRHGRSLRGISVSGRTGGLAGRTSGNPLLYDQPMPSIDERLAALESARRSAPDPGAVLEILASLERAEIRDSGRLVRFHDALLFLCAYPGTTQVLRRAESLLKRFGRRVAALVRTGDISPLLDPEVSGIAGTWVEVVFSYHFARWLAHRSSGGQLDIDWDEPPDDEKLATALTPLIPFLEEEANVDANVPYLEWLRAAGVLGKDGGLAWLLRNLDAALYDSLGLWIRWKLGNSAATRTLMRRPPRTIFYQDTPPLPRRDVSIAREIAGPPLPVSKLSRREGESVLDMARAAVATRYRELYGFTWGDPSTILSADGGRGLEILLIGIVPARRLPLRAGFAVFFLRNGVPIGYGDAFGLCERMEVSFNIFYAFRDGESAFCFARLLKLYHQLFGSTSFSIDPYQIGLGNEEAIEAGAFWFYRKLGFRSTDPLVERMARREEKRISSEPGHRTAARTLKRMARSPMIYGARDWDRFHIRNIGLRMSRENAVTFISLIPDLKRWSAEERAGVREIVRAKAGRSEERYLRLLARHDRLRRALLKLGSSRGGAAGS
jgi:hypothetical protein